MSKKDCVNRSNVLFNVSVQRLYKKSVLYRNGSDECPKGGGNEVLLLQEKMFRGSQRL